MKIIRLELHNYRNFSDVVLELGSETTLIFGDNGTGKTNLLRAIKQLLSFPFSYDLGETHFDFLASSSCKVISLKDEDARYGKDTEDKEFKYHFPIRTTLSANFGGKDQVIEFIEWTFEKESRGGRLRESLYREATLRFWEYYGYGSGELPVFAYFSDSYPFMNPRLPRKIEDKLRSGNPLPRNVGYYKGVEDRKNSQLWVVYFKMQYLNSIFSNDHRKAEYARAIKDALIHSSQPISNYNPETDFVLKDVRVEVKPTGDLVIFEFENGTQVPFAELPSSHLRFFSIVLDIASRGLLLNNNCNPSGVVLIDGLDLYLQPTEQRNILKRLRSTFPRIQWIVTTQSPLVLSAYEQKAGTNDIYKLSKDGTSIRITPIENTQGVDVNSILEYTMDTPKDDSRLNDYLEAYEFWASKGDKEKMANLKERIKDIVGENSLLLKKLKSPQT